MGTPLFTGYTWYDVYAHATKSFKLKEVENQLPDRLIEAPIRMTKKVKLYG
jgi:hypothetical protein